MSARENLFTNIDLPPVEAIMHGAGGTWGDIKTSKGLQGQGSLNEDKIARLEHEFGLDEILPAEEFFRRQRSYALHIYQIMKQVQPISNIGDYLHSWCPDFGKRVKGPFYSLINTDSSLKIDEGLEAPLIVAQTEQAIANPDKIILFAQGTDTVHLAKATKIRDAISFDTPLPPHIGAGSRTPFNQPNSDAPWQFDCLSKLAQIDLPFYLQLPRISPGTAFVGWTFDGRLYLASDLVKINPAETAGRPLEGQQTFFAPNASFQKPLAKIAAYLASGPKALGKLQPARWDKCFVPPEDHISRRLAVGTLFDAMTSVLTVNLEDENTTGKVLEQFTDPAYRAIVVAGHGTGNARWSIIRACERALDQGKLIYITSHCLIPQVNTTYGVSLLSINRDRGETGLRVISCGKLSFSSARALAIRSILEERDSHSSQLLVDNYIKARGLQ